MQITVLWASGKGIETQKKSFADNNKAIEFCRRNYEHILAINDVSTYGQKLNAFELMDIFNVA